MQRSSHGSSRRAPKNVSKALSAPHASPTPPGRPAHAVQAQQQLSQIEKSVTHLLVATKQLLGSSCAPTAPTAPANCPQRH